MGVVPWFFRLHRDRTLRRGLVFSLLSTKASYLIDFSIELVSAYPTAGGIYTSTAFVIPEKYRASVTFVTAWSVHPSVSRLCTLTKF